MLTWTTLVRVFLRVPAYASCLFLFLTNGPLQVCAESPSLKIGFIVPMTGSAATMGESLEGVVKIAKLEHITTIFEDDRCEGKTALSAYLKLRQQGIRLFYMACSGSILSVAPQAKINGDVILTTYAGSSNIRKTGSEVIRLNPDSISVADGMVPLVPPTDRPIVLMHEEQEYADSLATRLVEILGSDVIGRIPYKADVGSYATEILKIKQLNPKSLVLVPVGDASARIILRQLSQFHFDRPVIGDVNLCDYPFKLSEFGLQGRCVVAKFKGAAYDQFLADYTALLGHPPAYPFYDAMALDLVRYLDKNASKISDLQILKATLLKGFDGIFTRYDLSVDGEPAKAGDYLTIVEY